MRNKMDNKIKLFENTSQTQRVSDDLEIYDFLKNIRVEWDEKEEEWYFSIVDVITVLTENDYKRARGY